jgi:hypothetical protein
MGLHEQAGKNTWRITPLGKDLADADPGLRFFVGPGALQRATQATCGYRLHPSAFRGIADMAGPTDVLASVATQDCPKGTHNLGLRAAATKSRFRSISLIACVPEIIGNFADSEGTGESADPAANVLQRFDGRRAMNVEQFDGFFPLP